MVRRWKRCILERWSLRAGLFFFFALQVYFMKLRMKLKAVFKLILILETNMKLHLALRHFRRSYPSSQCFNDIYKIDVKNIIICCLRQCINSALPCGRWNGGSIIGETRRVLATFLWITFCIEHLQVFALEIHVPLPATGSEVKRLTPSLIFLLVSLKDGYYVFRDQTKLEQLISWKKINCIRSC